MLMDHADSQSKGIFRRGDRHLFSIDIDLPFIRKIDSRQHVHQCRLSASVLTENGKNLSFFDGQTYLVVRHDAAKPLRDVF